MVFAYCPECRSRVYVKSRPRLGLKLTCPCCELESTIADLDPLELGPARWAMEGEDDWEVELEQA